MDSVVLIPRPLISTVLAKTTFFVTFDEKDDFPENRKETPPFTQLVG